MWVTGPMDLDMGAVAAGGVGMGRWVKPQWQARGLRHLVPLHCRPRMDRNANIADRLVKSVFER